MVVCACSPSYLWGWGGRIAFRLQWDMMAPLHSSLGDRLKSCLEKKKSYVQIHETKQWLWGQNKVVADNIPVLTTWWKWLYTLMIYFIFQWETKLILWAPPLWSGNGASFLPVQLQGGRLVITCRTKEESSAPRWGGPINYQDTGAPPKPSGSILILSLKIDVP